MIEQLNEIISLSLWAPCGDPDDNQLRTAAIAYRLLIEHNLEVYSKEDVEDVLKGSNVCEQDYLTNDRG